MNTFIRIAHSYIPVTDFVDASDTLMMHALKSVPRKGQKFVFKVGDIVHTAWSNMKVYVSPQLIADVSCILLSRVFLRVIEVHETQDKVGKTSIWIRAECDWVLASDGGESPFASVVSNVEEAEASWRLEETKNQRLASAVASMLVRSYSLPRCIRLARSIMKHAITYYPDTNLTKITDEIMENIMINLGGQTALTKQKVFEYIKAAAARQSNPKKAVIVISREIFEIISKRPSLWVKENLNVIITEDGQRQYDQFVMAAAMGDTELFQQFLQNKQELTSLHSHLHYTALHAAAEFGKVEIINMLLGTGLSLDIKDPVRGQTALHFAGFAGRSEVALALLEGGANRQIVCSNDLYPFQAADKQGHIDCREILKFLPPMMATLTLTDVSINTISLQWKAPVLDRSFYAKVEEYQIICQCTEELHPDTQKSIPDPPPVLTSTLSCSFKRLVSACEYRCRIRCKSVSGWSEWSNWVYAHTRSYIPDVPASPEIRKVTINALYLNWYKPVRCNGSDIDYYEIELRDQQSIAQIAQETASLVAKFASGVDQTASKTEESMKVPSCPDTRAVRLPASHVESRKMGDSLIAQQGGVSKMHRVVKHKDVVHLFKCLTGLEPGRMYCIRIRAHNAMGFSGWSLWSTPVAPQVGVRIASFINESKSVELTWFQPILSEFHHIDCYELQLCKVLAPRSIYLHSRQYNELHHPELLKPKVDPVKKSAFDYDDDNYFDDEYTLERKKRELEEEEARKKREDEEKAKEDLLHSSDAAHLTRGGAEAVEDGGMNEDFHTIASDIKTNHFVLTQLKAGGRYVVRVRTKLAEEGHWMSWDHALRSDTFATPPSIPDPPIRVQPRRRLNQPKKESRRPLSPENSQTRTWLQQQSLSHSGLGRNNNTANTNGGNLLGEGEGVKNDINDIFPSLQANDKSIPIKSAASGKPSKAITNIKPTSTNQKQFGATNFSGYVDNHILIRKNHYQRRGDGNDDDDNDEEETEDDRSLSWWNVQIAANEKSISEAESQMAKNHSVGVSTHSSINVGQSKSAAVSDESRRSSLFSIIPDVPELRKPNQHEPFPLSFYQSSGDQPTKVVLPTLPYSDTILLPQEDDVSHQSGFYTKHPAVGSTTFDMGEFLASASLTATLPYEREDSYLIGDDSQDGSSVAPAFALTAPGSAGAQENESQSVHTRDSEIEAQLDTDLWDITHDGITITWTPGDSNGENLNDCEIQIAEIKTYNHEDVLCARNAFLGIHFDEKRQERILREAVDASDAAADGGSSDGKLVWERVNDRGTFVTPSAFRVQSLVPGGVYVFRVRHRNRIGWSQWSKASAMIATYPSVAPTPPTIIFSKTTFSVVVWEEIQYKQSQLTTLEIQLQIATVSQTASNSSNNVHVIEDDEDCDWHLVSASRPIDKKEIESFLGFSAKEYSGKNLSGAMIERLVEGRFYKVRVRVRTVVGWSPWSNSSDTFRTTS